VTQGRTNPSEHGRSTGAPLGALRVIAERIDALPSVARRCGGTFGTAAISLPGGRILGLRLREGCHLEVHVAMAAGEWSARDVECDVRRAVGDAWCADRVDVFIDGPAFSGRSNGPTALH
jgi:hypothetical protein